MKNILIVSSIVLGLIGCFLLNKNYIVQKKPVITKIMESKNVDRDKCEEWLFGDDYSPLQPYLSWNKLHGDIFIVSEKDLKGLTWSRWANECAKRNIR